MMASINHLLLFIRRWFLERKISPNWDRELSLQIDQVHSSLEEGK